MENKVQPLGGQNELTNDPKGLLVQEYLGTVKRTEDAATRRWQAAAFLVGGVIAAAGLIIARQSHGMETFVQTMLLGVLIIFALHRFRYRFLRRHEWRLKTLYDRQNDLEEKLGFFTNRYISTLDAIDDFAHKKENNSKVLGRAKEVLIERGVLDKDIKRLDDILKQKPEELSESDREYLVKLLEKCKYRRVAAQKFINLLPWVGIIVWLLLIISELGFWLVEDSGV